MSVKHNSQKDFLKNHLSIEKTFLILRTQSLFFVSLIVFILLLYFLPAGYMSGDLGNTVLTISTFLFGILAGFYIIITSGDYTSLKSAIATETSAWITLYNNMVVYNKKAGEDLAKLIDKYVIRAFDFEIIDYARATESEFAEISQFIQKLKFEEKRSSIHQQILDSFSSIVLGRQQLTVLGAKALMWFQWFVLFILSFLVIFSLYGLRTGETFFEVVTVLVSGSVILVLGLIRELDLYILNEKTFGYEVFENIFKAIGVLPYYPFESIKNGRIKPGIEKYRIGFLKDNSNVEKGRKIQIVSIH